MYLKSTIATIIFAACLLLIQVESSTICSQWGPECRNNNTLVYCMRKNDQLIESHIMTCPENSRCDNSAKHCTPYHETGLRFDCQEHGIFPDPYSCGHYYVCYYKGSKLNIIWGECPPGQFYNSKKNVCTHSGAGQCKTHFKCEYPGETRAWPDNSNIYYVCAVNPDGINPYRSTKPFLYRKVYRCTADEIFNGVACVERV